jgi:hypothetical protein
MRGKLFFLWIVKSATQKFFPSFLAKTKYGFFYTPFAIFEEKSFHLLEGIINFYGELEGQKCKKPTPQYFEKRFFL